MNGWNDILDKLNLPEKILYFKKLLWVFLLLFFIYNIIIFYFLYWFYYFLALTVWNVVLFWTLVPLFIFIWKTYLVDKWMEIVDEARWNIEWKYKERVVKVVEKDDNN